MCGEFPQDVVCQFILHDCAQNLDQIHAHRFVVRGFLVRGFVDALYCSKRKRISGETRSGRRIGSVGLQFGS